MAQAESPRPFRVFATPAYAWLLSGAFVSNVGTWMERIAVGVYVAERTGPGWTGTVAAVLFLPTAVLAPLGGALADRFERRAYLSVITLVLTGLAGVLAALAFLDRLSLPVLLVLMLLTGAVSALHTPGFTALLSEVVPEEHLTSAIFLNSGQWNVARILGPTLAAWIMAWGGVRWAFVANTVSFWAVLLTLAASGVRREPSQRGESVREGLRAGVLAVRNDPGIALVLVLALGTGVLVAPFIGLAPAFAVNVLAIGASGTSLLLAAQGAGAVFSSVFASTWADRIGSRRWLEWAGLALGPTAAWYWASGSEASATRSIFVLGAVYLAVVTGCSHVCLGRSPARIRARVSSLFNVVLDGGYALGLVALGWAADRWGLQRMAWVGCGAFVALYAGLRWGRREAFARLD